jgi:hypothetical protein
VSFAGTVKVTVLEAERAVGAPPDTAADTPQVPLEEISSTRLVVIRLDPENVNRVAVISKATVGENPLTTGTP